MDYEEFRIQYEQQHPASVPQEEELIGEYPRWVTWAVGCMFATAAFFSGLHTVPVAHDAIDPHKVSEWLRAAGGVTAFLFIESGVLISAYMLVKRWSKVMLFIMGLTIIVATGANLYSVASALTSQTADAFTKVITVLFGIVAPLMAALSGGVFVWLHQADRAADARMKTKYRNALVAWDDEIMTAFKAFERAQKRVSRAPKPASNGHSERTIQVSSKRIDASQIVKDYLASNPEAMNLSPRHLAGLLDVGKSTVHNVQRELRSNGNGHHQNGHAPGE